MQGKFQNNTGKTECYPCEAGHYSDKEGLEECTPCPYPLQSSEGSISCSFCAKGYYLKEVYASNALILKDPLLFCKKCPSNADCGVNTTIHTLNVTVGFWRHSNESSIIYKCKSHRSCSRTSHNLETFSDGYCTENHTGALCQVCKDSDYYFSDTNGICKKCPSKTKFALFVTLSLGVAVALFAITLSVRKHSHSITMFIQVVDIPSKFKVFVSFHQVVSAMETVYGVRLSSVFDQWRYVIDLFSLDLLNIVAFPMSCIGSTRDRIVIYGTWPLILIWIGIMMISVYAFFVRITSQNKNMQLKVRLIQWIIIVVYFTLPLVSRSIFDAIKCISLHEKDEEFSPMRKAEIKSYLMIDMKIQCDINADPSYASVQQMFWIYLVLWPILTPIGLFTLLIIIRKSIISDSITGLANACRFLWADYDKSLVFWDMFDLGRKIFLVGFIMFIDQKEGSTKSFRLAIAGMVSLSYLVILVATQPYRRTDNYFLALVSNFLLVLCFMAGSLLKICSYADGNIEFSGSSSVCDVFFGLSLNSNSISILLFLLTFGMTVITICLLFLITINKIRMPKLIMKATGYAPNMEMPENCKYHVFMSHTWSTGQAKTHAIVRKLQMTLPSLQVWLDIDKLQDLSSLKQGVAESAVFIIFYSSGYFRSKNCNQELCCALELNKPIIVIYEGEQDLTLKEMMDEFLQYCTLHSKFSERAYQLFCYTTKRELGSVEGNLNSNPIQWLHDTAFSAVSMRKIFFSILSNLPYYKKHRAELYQGITVPGECDSMRLLSPVNVFVHDSNVESWSVAEEVKSSLLKEQTSMINIFDAAAVFQMQHEVEGICPHYMDEDFDNFCDHSTLKLPSKKDRGKCFFLLYLNKYTFTVGNHTTTETEELLSVLKKCVKNNVKVILVHEQDGSKGSCDFDQILKYVPEELLIGPMNIFQDLAVPLYPDIDYREVSFKKILGKLGAVPLKHFHRKSLLPLFKSSNILKT